MDDLIGRRGAVVGADRTAADKPLASFRNREIVAQSRPWPVRQMFDDVAGRSKEIQCPIRSAPSKISIQMRPRHSKPLGLERRRSCSSCEESEGTQIPRRKTELDEKKLLRWANVATSCASKAWAWNMRALREVASTLSRS